MSKFAEMLETLIFEHKMDFKSFSSVTGIAASCITDYVHGNIYPSIANLIKIADYFQCSTDYLLGLEDENKNLTFKPCPPFNEQIKSLKEFYKCPAKKFYDNNGITKSGYFEWKNGTRQPSLDSIIKLANTFDCRVDFILGRQN